MQSTKAPYRLLTVEWTPEQRKVLEPLFDDVKAANAANAANADGYAGVAILGQVYADGVFVRSLTHEQALQIAESIARVLGTPALNKSSPAHASAETRISEHSGAHEVKH